MDHAPAEVIGRVAVALYHAPLRRQDARLAMQLLPLAFVGGRRQPFRVAPHTIAELGWASSKTSASRSLRRLTELGILTRWRPGDRFTWELQLPERWTWDADAAELAASTWDAMIGSPWGAADELVAEARAMIDAVPAEFLPDRERPTWHPMDPPTQRWLDRMTRLVERHGWSVVRLALRTASRQPDTVAPWRPSAFAREIWALAIRGRHLFGAAL